MSCALFYETDSDDEDDGPFSWDEGFYAAEAMKLSPGAAPPAGPPAVFAGFPPEDPAQAAWEAAAGLVLDSLAGQHRAPVQRGVMHASKMPLAKVIPGDVPFREVRAKLDLHVYPSPAHFEADVLSYYLNLRVLYSIHQPPGAAAGGSSPKEVHAYCQAELGRLAALFERHGLAPCVTSRRLGGGGAAGAAAAPSEHAIAYKRVVEKVTLLDQGGVLGGGAEGMEDEEEDYSHGPAAAHLLPRCPATLDDIREALAAGAYATDLAFELDLRALLLNLLAAYDPTTEAWGAAHALLALVPECLDEAGVDAHCVPPPPKAAAFAEQGRCRDILGWFQELDVNKAFLGPVECVPNYRKRIMRPMDCSTVQLKLDLGIYRSAHGFAEDMLLMLQNCQLWWNPGNEYNQLAASLQAQLRAKLQEARIAVGAM